MFCCCKEQSSWVFVYENDEIYGICDKHFDSPAHGLSVKHVIKLSNGKLYDPKILENAVFVEAT